MLWAAHVLTATPERPIPLGPADIAAMVAMAEALERLAREPAPPAAAFAPICASCSYRHLCGAA